MLKSYGQCMFAELTPINRYLASIYNKILSDFTSFCCASSWFHTETCINRFAPFHKQSNAHSNEQQKNETTHIFYHEAFISAFTSEINKYIIYYSNEMSAYIFPTQVHEMVSFISEKWTESEEKMTQHEMYIHQIVGNFDVRSNLNRVALFCGWKLIIKIAFYWPKANVN